MVPEKTRPVLQLKKFCYKMKLTKDKFNWLMG